LSEFASGNRARLVRYDQQTGKQTRIQACVWATCSRTATSANVKLEPGDVIIIPESMF
jgi:polysaccharide export outer membrane protein